MLTVVFERRPPSPSIQTSIVLYESFVARKAAERGIGHTFSLDLFTLGEGEVGSQEIWTVGHCS